MIIEREPLFHLCTKSSSKSAPAADEEEKARKGRLATSIKLPTNNTIMSVFFVNLDHSRFFSLSFWANRLKVKFGQIGDLASRAPTHLVCQMYQLLLDSDQHNHQANPCVFAFSQLSRSPPARPCVSPPTAAAFLQLNSSLPTSSPLSLPSVIGLFAKKW